MKTVYRFIFSLLFTSSYMVLASEGGASAPEASDIAPKVLTYYDLIKEKKSLRPNLDNFLALLFREATCPNQAALMP